MEGSTAATPRRHRVLGVDACRAGWVGVVLGAEPCGFLASDIATLADRASVGGPLQVVAIDIPIGVPERGRRRADELARAELGPRRSSVFMTPVRAALVAPDHRRAVELNRQLAGEGVSVQAYGLRHRILQVEEWARRVDLPVIEAHPEVCFAAMAGRPLEASKRSWTGLAVRRQLLAAHRVELPDELGESGAVGRTAGADDVLDAAAAAWTADRFASGRARSIPDPPQTLADGRPCAIWV